MSMVSVFDTLKTSTEKNAEFAAMAFVFGAMTVLGLSVFLDDSDAFAEKAHTTTARLDDTTSLQKTEVLMSVPEGNTLPWGTIKGKVEDPVQGYPVIIQFFKSIEEDPVHVAQVGLKGDNSFEYRFRVMSSDGVNTTHFFEGDYTVKIFKVVNTPKADLDSV